jgi:hypothetical protein
VAIAADRPVPALVATAAAHTHTDALATALPLRAPTAAVTADGVGTAIEIPLRDTDLAKRSARRAGLSSDGSGEEAGQDSDHADQGGTAGGDTREATDERIEASGLHRHHSGQNHTIRLVVDAS